MFTGKKNGDRDFSPSPFLHFSQSVRDLYDLLDVLDLFGY